MLHDEAMVASASPPPLPTPSTTGFFVPAAAGVPSTSAAALCIHGYTGVPMEVRLVADALAARGVSAAGLLLPGHGTDPLELTTTSWQDWYRAADDALHALPHGAAKIVVGSSMGALLSILLAARYPHDVRALVLLAPALRFHQAVRPLGRAAAAGLWRVVTLVPKEVEGGDIADADGRKANRGYPVLPVRGVGELSLLQREARRQLARITSPVIVFHGAQDHTIAPVSSEMVLRGVRSSVREHHVLRDSFHVLGLDVDRGYIAERAADFALRCLPRWCWGAA